MRNENLKGNEKEVKEVRKLSKEEQDRILYEYFGNNRKGVRRVCQKVVKINFPSLTQKDWDEMESLAGEVFVKIIEKYDSEKCEFEGYFFKALSFKFISYLKYITREKRSFTIKDEKGNVLEIIEDISLYTPAGEEQETTLEDFAVSNVDVEREVMENAKIFSPKMEEYLRKLTRKQRKVINLLAEGYKPKEIQEQLKITSKQYRDCVTAIKNYKNTQILY